MMAHTLLGTAYVYDIIDGEALEEVEHGRVEKGAIFLA